MSTPLQTATELLDKALRLIVVPDDENFEEVLALLEGVTFEFTTK